MGATKRFLRRCILGVLDGGDGIGKTEDGRRCTGDGVQETEYRRQNAGDRMQETGDISLRLDQGVRGTEF